MALSPDAAPAETGAVYRTSLARPLTCYLIAWSVLVVGVLHSPWAAPWIFLCRQQALAPGPPAVAVTAAPRAEPPRVSPERASAGARPPTEAPKSERTWVTEWPAGADALLAVAKEPKPITDKFTAHRYETMYGMFLAPLRKAAIKFLEIGLGCSGGVLYGGGVFLWKRFLPKAKLWFAEYDRACADAVNRTEWRNGIGVLIGDQSSEPQLKQWISTSGGDFDVVVDDGGHSNTMIMNSFKSLWPPLLPGGLYFLEDLQVAGGAMRGTPGIVNDIVQEWIDELLQPAREAAKRQEPLPTDAAFLMCQLEACLLGKDAGEASARTEWPQHVREVSDAAKSCNPVPDKFSTRRLETMYGVLLGLARRAAAPVKVLEVGLACREGSPRSWSPEFWRRYMPAAELWFADSDSACADGARTILAQGGGGGHVLTGDPGKKDDVKRWATEGGSAFDIVVDNGGVSTASPMARFEAMWPTVQPGGFYLMDGLHQTDVVAAVSDVLQDWTEQMLLMPQKVSNKSKRHPVPEGVTLVFCQPGACAVGKKYRTDRNR